ncbi:MAG: sigma-54 dependent DNA-binding response regulator [Polyangiaceae bacterium]|jgi:DNA-binding NtrC family response regulator|nr:sigma-54 dependent DNA-binding response regulator [Polyangiaceae bacterium]
MSGLKILLVDDQPAVLAALEVLFEVHGFETVTAQTPEQALALVRSEELGVVLQDMNFHRDATSGEEGEALLHAIRKLDPDLPVVLMTAFQSLEAAVRLVRAGASDYIAKPWNDDKLVATVKNLIRLRELSQENLRLRASSNRMRAGLASEHDLCGLIYASAAMHEVVRLAAKVAPSEAAVLVTGPNGSGKERVAQIVQANSRRKDKPFVKVNAGGLPDELLEAELFGAEAGAYTGAKKLRIGRFEEADGGTLFLDEIGNLSTMGQMKLLRVLQTGEFQRLGSNATRKVDVRLISATNADLPRAIAQGTFREDLYFRLNVIELAIPPLCDRPDDVLPLAEHLLGAHHTQSGQPYEMTSDARQALIDYEWPGNVRELENRIQRATLVCQAPRITEGDLGLGEGGKTSSTSLPAQLPPKAGAADPERAELERVLVQSGGVVATAAAMLGISRQALYRRMDRLGVELERRPKV